MFSSRGDEDNEWVPATDEDRQAVLAQLERLIGSTADDWVPANERERASVLAQLELLLDDARFRFSRHYPRFLRYVVQKAVQGETVELNERALGVEVFARPIDYDLDADPIVRVTAAEIRDRIAQYYEQEEHAGELRIDLPYGSYVPRFRRPRGERAHDRQDRSPERNGDRNGDRNGERGTISILDRPADRLLDRTLDRTLDGANESVPKPAPLEIPPASVALPPRPREVVRPAAAVDPRQGSKRGSVVWVLLLLILAQTLVIGSGVAKKIRPDPVITFWQLGDGDPAPVMVCVREATLPAAVAGAGRPDSVGDASHAQEMILLSDALVANRITTAISYAGLNPEIRNVGKTTLADLQQGPVVIIGGPDNDWTLRLTESLPFRFARLGEHGAYQIVDARNPGSPPFAIDRSLPYTASTQDYAVVARFLNPLTEKPTVIVAGLGANGASAASSLVTSSFLFTQFVSSAPKDWRQRNFELLVTTQTDDGKTVSPKIIASQYW